MHKKTHRLIFRAINFQAHKSHFQALFKENYKFSRQVEKSSTFQDNHQIQALFKVCGNHDDQVMEYARNW